MRTLLIALIVAAAAACFPGCANYSQPVGATVEMKPAERNFENLWQASRHVLASYYFTVDREDRRAGVLVTDAMTGEHFGEFWRKDAATRDDLAESTVQTIYRQATVRIEPVGEGAESFRAVVQVQAFRSNHSDTPASSTSEALKLFRFPGNRRLDDPREDKDQPLRDEEGDPHMVLLGRDESLEAKLTADIQAKAGF